MQIVHYFNDLPRVHIVRGYLDDVVRASDRLLERGVVVEVSSDLLPEERSVTKCICCTVNADEVPAKIQVILQCCFSGIVEY